MYPVRSSSWNALVLVTRNQRLVLLCTCWDMALGHSSSPRFPKVRFKSSHRYAPVLTMLKVPAFGRNIPYITTFALFTILSLPTALVDNLGGLLVLRFLQGFFGSPCLANGGASMGVSIYLCPKLRCTLANTRHRICIVCFIYLTPWRCGYHPHLQRLLLVLSSLASMYLTHLIPV